LPAYPTSMGRVLLSGLSDRELDDYVDQVELEELTRHTVVDRVRLRSLIVQCRNDGFALVDQELEEGVRSIAAPVRNSNGEIVAAVNLSCHASRVDMNRMESEFRPCLLETAAEVSERLRSLPP